MVDGDIISGQFYDLVDDVLENLFNGDGQFDVVLGIYGIFCENIYGGIIFNNLVSSCLLIIVGIGISELFFSYYIFMLGYCFEFI